MGVIVQLRKKGDTHNCNNYRGIKPLIAPMKVYESTLEKRLRKIIEPPISEEQSGFRRGRSIHDHIFTIKNLVRKTRDNKRNFFLIRYDEKEYGKVYVEEKQIMNLQMQLNVWIEKMRKNVVGKNMKLDTFPTLVGLRRGVIMSSILYTVFMGDMMKEC